MVVHAFPNIRTNQTLAKPTEYSTRDDDSVNYWFSVKEHKTRLTSRRYIIQILEHSTAIHPSTSKDGLEVTLSQIRTVTVAR